MKQQQEEERLAREAKKKAEEEAAKREKEKRLETERQKREQERIKKEEERRHREEERLKKEEEKKRRIKEERERLAEKERKRKEREEKERKEKEEKERLEKEKVQKAKAERELKAEKERLRREAKAAAKAEKVQSVDNTPPGISQPIAISNKTSSDIDTAATTAATAAAVAVTDDSESRQQVLIEALVGSRPNNAEPIVPAPITNTASTLRPPPQLQQQTSFMPSHLDILQGGGPPTSSLLSNTFPLDHMSPPNLSDPSMMSIFNNRVGSPLEQSTSTRQGRSITPIAPIGQPLNGRRVSSVPSAAVGSPLHDLQSPTSDTKRPSITSPFDNESGPRSFFSSFLFGEPNRGNIIYPLFM